MDKELRELWGEDPLSDKILKKIVAVNKEIEPPYFAKERLKNHIDNLFLEKKQRSLFWRFKWQRVAFSAVIALTIFFLLPIYLQKIKGARSSSEMRLVNDATMLEEKSVGNGSLLEKKRVHSLKENSQHIVLTKQNYKGESIANSLDLEVEEFFSELSTVNLALTQDTFQQIDFNKLEQVI